MSNDTPLPSAAHLTEPPSSDPAPDPSSNAELLNSTVEYHCDSDGGGAAPEPPHQTAARYERVEDEMKNPIELVDDEAPVHPSQIDDDRKKRSESIDHDDALLPLEHVVARTFKDESAAAAPPASRTRLPGRVHPHPPSDGRPLHSTVIESPVPSLPFSLRGSRNRPHLMARPLPRHDTRAPSSSSALPLEATLVQDTEAILIEPVHAVPVQMTRWKRYRRYIIGIMCVLLIGLAAVVGVSLGSDTDSAPPITSNSRSEVSLVLTESNDCSMAWI